jgi:hypothetical protein
MMHPYRIGLQIQQVDFRSQSYSIHRIDRMCSDGLRVSFPSDRQAAMLCNAVSSAQAAFTVGQHVSPGRVDGFDQVRRREMRDGNESRRDRRSQRSN